MDDDMLTRATNAAYEVVRLAPEIAREADVPVPHLLLALFAGAYALLRKSGHDAAKVRIAIDTVDEKMAEREAAADAAGTRALDELMQIAKTATKH